MNKAGISQSRSRFTCQMNSGGLRICHKIGYELGFLLFFLRVSNLGSVDQGLWTRRSIKKSTK